MVYEEQLKINVCEGIGILVEVVLSGPTMMPLWCCEAFIKM